MDLKVLCIFATILIVSAGASRFDLGPQRFYESSSPAPRREVQNGDAKEIVLYLTPGQIKALEAGGAVVRPAEPENDPEEASEEAQQNDDQAEENADQEPEQEQEQEEETETEAEQPEQQEEVEQAEQNQENDEQLQVDDLDLEEIFRILNEEPLEQEVTNAELNPNESQVTEEPSEEENAKEERPIPRRFQNPQKQQRKQQRQEKSLATADQKARAKIYAAIRYRNEQLQRARVQFARQQDASANQDQQNQEEPQPEAPLTKRYKLIPYKVVEQPEESTSEQPQDQQVQDELQAQEEQVQTEVQQQADAQQENEDRLNALLTPILSPEQLAEVIGQRKNKLSQSELRLQAILRELKQSSKYNDQKYAIEIEKLRTNLQKQNTLAKLEALAKAAPPSLKKEIQKQKPAVSAKYVRGSAPALRSYAPQRPKASRPQPVEVSKSVPVPVSKTPKEVARAVPVEVEKRVPVPVTRNVYAKVNKPYLVERIVPVEIKKEIPVEVPVRTPQRVTILRHLWEH